MKKTIRPSISAALVCILSMQILITLPAAAQEAAYTDAVTGPTVDAPEGKNPDAVSGATEQGGKALNPNFFGMNVSVNAHRATGYAAGGLFAAAGVIGGIRFLDLMERSHAYRGDDSITDSRSTIIKNEWADGQALRWTHVGLLGAGESLYLFDAVTGMSMIKNGGPTTRAGKIHRTAFFVHAGLMAAEMVLGFLETDALQRGDHQMIINYGAVHTGIGIAIPVVILGSGLAIDLYPGVEVKH